MLDEKSKAEVLLRLKRIEGQVRGVEKMVDEKRYCIDILDQISAVKKALDGVAMSLVKTHVGTCVSTAIRADKGEKHIDELVETLGRWVK